MASITHDKIDELERLLKDELDELKVSQARELDNKRKALAFVTAMRAGLALERNGNDLGGAL